jgi:glucose/arabinose dehydrogenase
MKRIAAVLLVGVCALVACDDDSIGPGTPPGLYHVEKAFPNLTFSRPTDVQNAGDGTNRLFVTQQTGQILAFPNQPDADSVAMFLDISSEVNFQQFSEMGLLGLAFHPQYETNGFFFVQYTAGTPAARKGRVSRFQVSADPNVADPASEKILLEFDDDYPNHNGGAMCFGTDGYLYIAIGDEGGAGDTDNNAQDRSRIFGKILRIDVDQDPGTVPYHGIPPDNPYVGNLAGFREDIFAYGLRNPWRISFDGPTGHLMAGDVGQRSWEEVDIIEKGGNYGWDCREGHVDYDERDNPSSPLCATAGPLKEPIAVYGRSDGSSITGGYIYRGPTLTDLIGRYVYGDFSSGRIWALNVTSGSHQLLVDTGMFISTFGVAEDHELFVASYFADGVASTLYLLKLNPQ